MSASERPVRGHDSAIPGPTHAGQRGLTKREYIATQALAGLIANERVRKDPRAVAIGAVQLADALLEELAK